MTMTTTKTAERLTKVAMLKAARPSFNLCQKEELYKVALEANTMDNANNDKHKMVLTWNEGTCNGNLRRVEQTETPGTKAPISCLWARSTKSFGGLKLGTWKAVLPFP